MKDYDVVAVTAFLKDSGFVGPVKHCFAKDANKYADDFTNQGFFAKVMTDEELVNTVRNETYARSMGYSVM